MSNSSVCPIAGRTSARQVWLRFMLAAFLMAIYTVIAMAGGVARADDGTSASGGETTSKGATSQQSEPQKSATDATSDQAAPAGAKPTKAEPPKADPPKADDSEAPTTPDTSNATKTTTPKPTATAEPTASTAPDPPHAATVTPPVDDAQAPTAAPVDTTTPETPPVVAPEEGNAPAESPTVDTEPKSTQPVDVSHGSKRLGQPAAVAAPASAEPRPTTTAESNVRSLRPQVDPEPAGVAAAAIAPPAPTPGIPIAFNPPLLVQQLTGLVADAGTIMVSVVHTAATAVAQAFGPNSFLGVPYMLATTVANVAAAVGRSIIGAPMFEPTTGQFAVNYGILDGLAFFNPTKPPAGANDDGISVTAQHPLPVILLNGTSATQGTNWSVGAPVLANAGYKVYTFNYGNTTGNPNSPIQAFGDIRDSTAELAAEVQRVLDETGAPKVILVGHSQGGGILAVNYINNMGGAAKVSQLIGIAPSNHGTDIDGLGVLQSVPILGPLFVGIANTLGPALYQQALGSPFQQEVYGNGDTRPGVLYTTIASVNDEVVTPYTQQALNGPNVTNVVLQDLYPGLVLGHANIFLSPQVWSTVLDALANNPAANPLQTQSVAAA
ncbi:alpha/beta fold hydrolase [Mycolicibacterium sp. P9-64]|uniref:esterase/lipase family protein n=1 Tax=Mycolicibacterium sp. P9-64 TaxID=2024612 RepID=UPI001F5B9267|nr:alpha/beta fold hydrolase [Mycolicibacterium sp. P9-64]